MDLEEIDDYLGEQAKLKTRENQRQEEKTSHPNPDTDVLFYRMKNMSKEFPIKEVDGKMECPFCKTVVKNVKLHFEKKIDCGKEVDKEHFLLIFEQYKRRRDLEKNRIYQQRYKEKDPIKYKKTQEEARNKRKEKDPKKYKKEQEEARNKRKEQDPEKYKADYDKANKRKREADPETHKETKRSKR